MDVVAFLSAALVAGTPILLATLGEILTEKVGNLNLGVEGMMLIGAVSGVLVANSTQNPILSLLTAIFAGAAAGLIYAFITVTLRANQVVTGLTLSIFGSGFASMLGKSVVGVPLSEKITSFFGNKKIPVLGDIPVIGKIFFNHDLIFYLSLVLVVLLMVYIYKTGFGLNLKAVGENPHAAETSGINVIAYKYVHICTGGALCGLAGAYLSLVYVPVWQENITAGRGWIAVALVIFATWNPLKAAFVAYLFGALDILSFRITGAENLKYFLDMLPYALTIVVLIFISSNKKGTSSPPKSLGESYFREER